MDAFTPSAYTGKVIGVRGLGRLPIVLHLSVLQQRRKRLANCGVGGDFLLEQKLGLLWGHRNAFYFMRLAPGQTLQLWSLGTGMRAAGCCAGIRTVVPPNMLDGLLCVTVLPEGFMVAIVFTFQVCCKYTTLL